MKYDMEFIKRLLEIGEEYDLQGEIYWRCGPTYYGRKYHDPASFFINCNDLFWWGTADLEEITPDNIDVLEQALVDCRAAERVVGSVYGPSLFACRVRGLRPQGAAYPRNYPSLWPLFDACGPPREVGLGNPLTRPTEADAKSTQGGSLPTSGAND